jgi:hypothetical protein
MALTAAMARASAPSEPHGPAAPACLPEPQDPSRAAETETKNRISLLVWTFEIVDHLFSDLLKSSCEEPFDVVGGSLTETLHLAAAMLDLCLVSYYGEGRELTMVAVSAVLLASKYHINADFNVKSAHEELGFPLEGLLRSEAALWKSLGYNLGGVKTLYKLCFSILGKALGGRDPSCVLEENPESFRVFELLNEALVLTFKYSEREEDNVTIACSLLKESFCFSRYPRHYFAVLEYATATLGCDKETLVSTGSALVTRVLKTSRKVEFIRDRHVSALALLSFEEQ